jgi:hypothetical protein
LLKTTLDMLVITRKAILDASWSVLRDDYRAAIEAIGRPF